MTVYATDAGSFRAQASRVMADAYEGLRRADRRKN